MIHSLPYTRTLPGLAQMSDCFHAASQKSRSRWRSAVRSIVAINSLHPAKAPRPESTVPDEDVAEEPKQVPGQLSSISCSCYGAFRRASHQNACVQLTLADVGMWRGRERHVWDCRPHFPKD